MTWKNAAQRALKNEMKPMTQFTYWVVFLACGLTYVLKTVQSAAAASYEIIHANPEIISGSWLIGGIM